MLLLLATVVLAVTAGLAAGCLRAHSLPGFLLPAYLAAFSELVLLSLGLSLFDALTSEALLACLGLVLAALVGIALARRPAFPSVGSAFAALRSALRDPPLFVLAVFVAGGLLYVLGLAVLLPPNDGDAHAYHLARAALWRQQEAVAYVPGAIETRINVNPPNGELGALFTMLFAPGDRFVGLVQFTALLASLVAIVGIARRLGMSTRAALFGALVFATLPLMLLQGSSALNDLVVASFLLSATFFVLGRTRTDLGLTAVAIGLALGTKFTAPLLLPLLAVFAVLAHPRRRWPALVAAGAGGIALGSIWYLVNVTETGDLDGGLREDANQSVGVSFSTIAANLLRYAVDALDASGLRGDDAALYSVPAAALVAAALFALQRRQTLRAVRFVQAALVVFCLPIGTRLFGDYARRSYEQLWVDLGRRDLAFPFQDLYFWNNRIVADATASWYGPLGIVLPVLAVVLAWRIGGRDGRRRLRLAAAAAPFAALALFSLVLVWDSYRGRFFAYPMAMSAAVWGLILVRSRVVTWAVVGVAATTLALTLVHSAGEPAGMTLLESNHQSSVWRMERIEVVMLLRDSPHEQRIVEIVEGRVPRTSPLALAVRRNDFIFPFFGPRLERTVRLVAPGSAPPQDAEWLVQAPGVKVACSTNWEPVDRTGEWMLLRRRDEATCNPDTNPVATD